MTELADTLQQLKTVNANLVFTTNNLQTLADERRRLVQQARQQGATLQTIADTLQIHRSSVHRILNQ